MKHKSTKRTSSNKPSQNNTSSHNQTRRLSNSSTGTTNARTKSSNKVGSATETVCFDSNTTCFKANLTLKSQKVLKRDLLHCSDQRSSLSSSHTSQTPRIRHGSQQTHAFTSSSTSSINHGQSVRRRSLSADPLLSHNTNDPIGPWPDKSTNRIASAGNDLLHPIKNSRHTKNSRLFSPKYDASLTDNSTKFKYYTSPQTYIDEYRKQKGYLLGLHTPSKAISRSLPLLLSEDEQLSRTDTLNDGSEVNNDASRDRTITSTIDRMTASTTDLSLRSNALTKSINSFFDHMHVPPSIPTSTRNFHEPHHVNNFPAIALRNAGHLRSTRHAHHHHAISQQQQQQALALPPLNASSLQYLSGINSIDKIYSNSKKPSIRNHSKFFLIEGRNKKRISHRVNSDSEASRAQDYSDLRATGGPVITSTQRTTAVMVYQMPRPPLTIVTNQNDVG